MTRTIALTRFLVIGVLLFSTSPAFCQGILNAAKEGDLAAVKKAIANGEDKNKKSSKPSFPFGSSGFNKDGALSYSQDAEWTAMIHAAFKGHEAVVHYLLEIGADPNAVDFNGLTALMYAIIADNTNVVEVLSEKQEALDFREPSLGMTPLMWAIIHGKDTTVQALLSRKPNLQAQDNDGWTALHYAARRGRATCVGILLKIGAVPNTPDATGKTPLMVAAENGNADIAGQLLQGGADKSLKGKDGKTAIDYAKQKLGLGALKIERIDADSVRITDGFIYQKTITLRSEFLIRIKSIERGIIQPEGAVLMGAEAAVGVTWVFDKPGLVLHNGDYVYTSKVKDATIKFTKEGAILTGFQIENPNEEGIKKVLQVLSK